MPATTISSLALNRVYSTTLHAQRARIAMEIVQANALFWHFYRQNAVEMSAGPEIRMPVVLTESASVGAIGAYETFSTTPEDGPDTARFPTWFKNRASMILDNSEVRQNATPQKVVDLIGSKKAIMKFSLLNDIGRQFHGDNTATPKEIAGLRNFIDFDTTPDLTVGGISQATYPLWANQYGQHTNFGTDGLTTWETVYMNCSKKGTHPDIILSDPAVYRFFKRLVAPNQEESDKQMMDYGFLNLRFNGTPVVPDDELAGTGRTYFLTTSGARSVGDFNLKPEFWRVPGENPLANQTAKGIGLQLAILKDSDFRMTDFMTPPNQDTIIAHCFLECMLTCSSLGRQGCTDFSGSVVF